MHPLNLLSLGITPLRFRLETLGPFRVPEYKGALFRGGFGQFFRDLVCITRAPVCTGCPHLALVRVLAGFRDTGSARDIHRAA